MLRRRPKKYFPEQHQRRRNFERFIKSILFIKLNWPLYVRAQIDAFHGRSRVTMLYQTDGLTTQGQFEANWIDHTDRKYQANHEIALNYREIDQGDIPMRRAPRH